MVARVRTSDEDVEIGGRSERIRADGDGAPLVKQRCHRRDAGAQDRVGAGAQRDSRTALAKERSVGGVEMGAVSDVDVRSKATEIVQMGRG